MATGKPHTVKDRDDGVTKTIESVTVHPDGTIVATSGLRGPNKMTLTIPPTGEAYFTANFQLDGKNVVRTHDPKTGKDTWVERVDDVSRESIQTLRKDLVAMAKGQELAPAAEKRVQNVFWDSHRSSPAAIQWRGDNDRGSSHEETVATPNNVTVSSTTDKMRVSLSVNKDWATGKDRIVYTETDRYGNRESVEIVATDKEIAALGAKLRTPLDNPKAAYDDKAYLKEIEKYKAKPMRVIE